MTNPPARLSPADARQIDQTCDRFEAAWKAGRQPRPEEYLGTTERAGRAELLRQLLLLDWDYRRRSGTYPCSEEYHRRFPGDRDLIEAVSQEMSREAAGFLTPTAAGMPTTDSPALSRPGTVIGPYKLLQQIGEGGMGIVFMAEQEEPIRRRVALKIIKPGMDSRQVVARFEAERQALALMDHPNIARVLDASTTDTGQPYFVMELVHGVPMTKYCDDHHLTVRERLELLVPVCMAIQHAHQKGIIHRDLKPSNVLVCLHDGQPVPKVIDFGVAKAFEQRLTEQTMFTQVGQIIGTFEYMSPEQAEMSPLGVDTRSDIYSLGVMLYELLTGSTPFQRLREAGLTAMLKTIKEEEPTKPSTRVSSMPEAAKIASARRTEPTKLAKLVRGELDWIVMKALEKDRTRRYETANGLARDIQRYLADEPVEACPPSAGYRLRKFARKHRSVLATVGAFVLLLAAAALASTWQAIRATLAETKAREAQTTAEKQFDLAQQSETKARQAQEVAQGERQQAVTNLYHARVEEAAALRRARGMGYRARVFNRLQQALQLDTPDKDSDQLRDVAVACLGDFVGLEPITWEDFPARIRKIALTPDGEHLAIALDNGTIQLRNVSTGGVIAQLTEAAVDLGFDPANRWLVTAGAKGTIKVWQDYGTGGEPAAQTIEMHADFAGMARNGRFAVSYSQEKDGGLLSLWDVARQEVKARLNVPSGRPDGPLQVSDDGQWLAAASTGEKKLYALVWNTPVPEPKKIIFAQTYQDTKALSISHDGKFLACQHGDDGLILLDVHEAVPRPLIRDNEVAAACFSGDGRFLVYYSISGRVGLWNASRHQEVAALAHPRKGGQGEAFLATFSADGNTFATAAGVSRSIRIWKLAGSGEKLVLSGHEGGVPGVAFSPDGKVMASGSKDRLVKLWDTATGQLLRTLPRFDSPIQSIAFSPDGRLLATGQFGPTAQPVHIWDLATLQAIAAPEDELGQSAYGVAFSPDGKFFAACGHGLTIWRLAEGKQGAADAPHLSFERTAHLPGRRSLYLCISSNSKLLAWVDHNYLVCLWDLAKGREVPFIGPPLDHGWHNLAFYPDSDHLTFGTARKMFETWDTRTARRVSSFGGGGHPAASPNGRWLATTDPALWSAQTGSRVFSLPEERGVIWSLALSPDGERLAVGLADGGLAIWNVPRMQAQLSRIGLAWRADARPPPQHEPQPFVPATPDEQKHQATHYSNLAKRLAWVGRFAEAEETYRAALKLKPDDPAAHGNLGKFLADQARYKEAVAEFNEAIKLQPEHGSYWVQRGWAYADMEQWEKASADFVKATECKEPDEEAWYSQAMLHLRDGNLDGYRTICSDMLQRFGAGAAWTCTLTPNSGADPARIISLVEKAFSKSAMDHWEVNRFGAALYRAGRFEEAVERLTEATKLSSHPHRTNMLCTWFFLAMAHHRLGHTDEARRWLDKGLQGTEEALKSSAEPLGKSESPDGVIPPNWNRRLTLQLLRREAEQLIQGTGTKPSAGSAGNGAIQGFGNPERPRCTPSPVILRGKDQQMEANRHTHPAATSEWLARRQEPEKIAATGSKWRQAEPASCQSLVRSRRKTAARSGKRPVPSCHGCSTRCPLVFLPGTGPTGLLSRSSVTHERFQP
jgi:WD40 repeat protein/serine/threonine protein kinase/tetratricopeptide (TPR) repeat protein